MKTVTTPPNLADWNMEVGAALGHGPEEISQAPQAPFLGDIGPKPQVNFSVTLLFEFSLRFGPLPPVLAVGYMGTQSKVNKQWTVLLKRGW